MLTSNVSHHHPGRSWWFGLALAWAVCPIATRAADHAAAPPPAQARLAAAEAPARFAEPEEPLDPAESKRGPRVVPIDFDSATLDKEALHTISQALWTRLDAMDDLALFPVDATRRWLIRNDLFPFTPYLPAPAPERITGALKADYLITGHLNRGGGVFTLDVSVYSGREKKYLLKDVKIVKATEAELLEEFAPLSARLHQAMTGKGAPAAGKSAPKPAKASKATAAPAKAKAKAGAAARKAPTQVRVTAKPRAAVAQRPAARKTTRVAAPAARPKAAAHERGAVEAHPAPEPRPTPTPSPEHHAAPAEAAPAGPAATPEPAGGRSEAGHDETPAPTPTSAEAPPARDGAAPAAASDPGHARELLEQAGRIGVSSKDRLKLLAQAALLDPANEEIQQQLAMEHYSQRDYEACIAQCEAAAARLPKAAMLRVIKGSALFELGRYEQAIEADREALKLDPRNVYGHFNLALALTHHDPGKAIAAWQDFITMFGGEAQHKALVEQARASLASLEPHGEN